MTEKYLSSVRNQYEELPYPPCDPKNEMKGLARTWLEDLPKINYYCFGGRNSFKNGFRALVAGGGTGDATIFLAHQLRNTDAQIVHVDLSSASIAIAQERARIRGLENITWIHDSLLNLPQIGLEKFDYINCSGVLHHLPDPDAGLVALRSVLKDSGALAIMVYASHGRTAVYQMQSLMRLINGEDDAIDRKLKNTKDILNSLPATNWFVRGEDLYHDHKNGDAGIYDLLLHSQDRAYSVPELYEWIEDRHRLHLDLTDVYTGRSSYLPHMLIGAKKTEVLKQIQSLPPRKQHAIAEILTGRIITHSFYATASAACKAPYGDVDYVPMFFHEPTTGPMMEKIFNTNKNKGRVFLLEHRQAGIAFPVNPGKYGPRILREIDGKKSFKEIFDIVRADVQYRFDHPSDETLFADFKESFDALNAMDRLLLMHRDVSVVE